MLQLRLLDGGPSWMSSRGFRLSSFAKRRTCHPVGALQTAKPFLKRGISPCAINDCNAIIAVMASITIRRLPETTKRRLRIRAARNGRSMEQEARELLETGLARTDSEPENLGEAIRQI